MRSPNWQTNSVMRLVIAGPWLAYILLTLHWRIREAEFHLFSALDLLACIFGALALVGAVAPLKQIAIFALLASLVFLITHLTGLVYLFLYFLDAPDYPSLSRLSALYDLIYGHLIRRIRDEGLIEPINSVMRDAVMPAIQVTIIAIFLVMRPNQPLNTEPLGNVPQRVER